MKRCPVPTTDDRCQECPPNLSQKRFRVPTAKVDTGTAHTFLSTCTHVRSKSSTRRCRVHAHPNRMPSGTRPVSVLPRGVERGRNIEVLSATCRWDPITTRKHSALEVTDDLKARRGSNPNRVGVRPGDNESRNL
ncbi:unnamed protein product [Ectocarpus sp. 13 AM-2016]